MYQKSRGPPGPDLWLWALRACSITSFMPFGRSGHVTHAVVQSLDNAFEKSRKITEKIKNNCKEISLSLSHYSRDIAMWRFLWRGRGIGYSSCWISWHSCQVETLNLIIIIISWHPFDDVPVLLDQVEGDLEEEGGEDQGVDAIVWWGKVMWVKRMKFWKKDQGVDDIVWCQG